MSGFSSPAITRSVVVLPAPDGPSRTKNAPSGMSSCERLERVDVAERLVRCPARRSRRSSRHPFLIETGVALTTCSVCGSYAGGGAPTWRTDTTCSSAKRAVGGMRTFSSPASVSTT